jgi:uncharacterized protein YegL
LNQEKMFGEVHLFYIVCDESGSMGPNGGIAAINQALPELHATLACDPWVTDKSLLSIIAFSDNAEVILPLCNVCAVADFPGVTAGGLTNYGTAFALLQTTIENDVNSMKSQGFRVHRPYVLFISGTEPLDGWELAYQSLTKHTYHPHIATYGVDGADPVILAKIATSRSYVGRDNPSIGQALASEFGLVFPNRGLAGW